MISDLHADVLAFLKWLLVHGETSKPNCYYCDLPHERVTGAMQIAVQRSLVLSRQLVKGSASSTFLEINPSFKKALADLLCK